ncbi:hypothetical protein ACHHYP_10606 [Achlya hypogyna]|uniref:Uncharacterized protein n=1 Tax=Achlya hypogyna TaxID=1202772 RepID=A0A1V9YKY2_ACHHY|nr:hypothetical protein ACHHYP_10606 [Achlya hypogyna]
MDDGRRKTPESPKQADVVRKPTLERTGNNHSNRVVRLESLPKVQECTASRPADPLRMYKCKSLTPVDSDRQALLQRTLAFPLKKVKHPRAQRPHLSSALSVGSSEQDLKADKRCWSPVPSNKSYPQRRCRRHRATRELPLGEDHWHEYTFERFARHTSYQRQFLKDQTKLLSAIEGMEALAKTPGMDSDELVTQLRACKAMVRWYRVGDHVCLVDMNGNPVLKPEVRKPVPKSTSSTKKRHSLPDMVPKDEPVTGTIRRDLHDGTYDVRIHKTVATIRRGVSHRFLRPKLRRKATAENVRPTSNRNFLLLDGMIRIELGGRVLVTYRDPFERRYGYFLGVNTNGTAVIQYDEKDVDARVEIKDVSAAAEQDAADDLATLVRDQLKDDVVILEGFRVLSKHPMLSNMQPCTVLRDNGNGTYDLQFLDGMTTSAVDRSRIEVESSVQEEQLKRLEATRSAAAVAFVKGQLVAAYSPRFLRYCAGHITGIQADAGLYTIAFDYGDWVSDIPSSEVTTLPDATLQRCGNLISYSTTLLGPDECDDTVIAVGHRVMARLCGSAMYFEARVESVEAKTVGVKYLSGVGDASVPRAHVFSLEPTQIVFVKPTRKSTEGAVAPPARGRKKSSLAQRFLSFFNLTENPQNA